MRCALCCLFGLRIAWGATGQGLGQFWVVDTSAPDTLQSLAVTIPSELTALGKFQYEIGVGTSEQAAIGELFDSLTVSLSQFDGTQSAILVTGDVFGITIAPLSPTGLLAGGAVSAQQSFADTVLLRDAPLTYAFTLEVSLPPALIGRDLRTSFDFFNNGDSSPTAAYAMVVPEPSACALAMFGGAICVWAFARSKKSRSAS
jgi:hypothetical protein